MAAVSYLPPATVKGQLHGIPSLGWCLAILMAKLGHSPIGLASSGHHNGLGGALAGRFCLHGRFVAEFCKDWHLRLLFGGVSRVQRRIELFLKGNYHSNSQEERHSRPRWYQRRLHSSLLTWVSNTNNTHPAPRIVLYTLSWLPYVHRNHHTTTDVQPNTQPTPQKQNELISKFWTYKLL